MKTLFPAVMALALAALTFQTRAAYYDPITSAKAIATQQALSQNGADVGVLNSVMPDNGGANTEMYSTTQMNYMVENGLVKKIVAVQDHCQFVSDIEDRARILKIPVFMFAWGDMLTDGICVRRDEELGLSYIRRAADEVYAPAIERLAFYYEKGLFFRQDLRKAENLMHTAAALGSPIGRLNWADMLIRGFGTPLQYAEAYGWLYHVRFDDAYRRDKQRYLQQELSSRMPAHAIARMNLSGYDR